MIRHLLVKTPIGDVRVSASDDAVVALHLPGDSVESAGSAPTLDGKHPLLARAALQLGEYFAGTRRAFDLPLAPTGTAWQQRVWTALCGIPYGATVAYVDIARELNSPGASRAVGGANGRNPIAIIIPCHRVIAAGGGLGGYSGGLDTKRWLLAHERRIGVARTRGQAPILSFSPIRNSLAGRTELGKN